MRTYLLFLLFSFSTLSAYEVGVDEIMAKISETRNDLLEAEKKNGLEEENLAFLTIWNFDNTILHGDTTEGLVDGEGKVVYKGLAEVAIEAGLSKKYPPSAFAQFWKEYKRMEAIDEVKAYAYPAQILAGAKPGDVLRVSKNYFQSTLKHHFFQSSRKLVAYLQNVGIKTVVITASPRLFVQGATSFLNLSLDEVFGMETTVKNGYLTNQMVLPLTTRQGKVDRIGEIVQKILASDAKIKKVYVLAGFGNDNANDRVFLNWIANQSFPSGRPLSVVGFQSPALPQNFVSLLLTEEISDY